MGEIKKHFFASVAKQFGHSSIICLWEPNQCIGFGGKILTENHRFSIKYGAFRFQFSLKPILWTSGFFPFLKNRHFWYLPFSDNVQVRSTGAFCIPEIQQDWEIHELNRQSASKKGKIFQLPRSVGRVCWWFQIEHPAVWSKDFLSKGSNSILALALAPQFLFAGSVQSLIWLEISWFPRFCCPYHWFAFQIFGD